MGALREALLPEPSFRSWQAYRGALWQTYPRFRGRLFARATVEVCQSPQIRQSSKLHLEYLHGTLATSRDGQIFGFSDNHMCKLRPLGRTSRKPPHDKFLSQGWRTGERILVVN